MRRTEFSTTNIRLILGFNYGWWMLMRILKMKSLALLTQMISLPTPILFLAVMVETYLARLEDKQMF